RILALDQFARLRGQLVPVLVTPPCFFERLCALIQLLFTSSSCQIVRHSRSCLCSHNSQEASLMLFYVFLAPCRSFNRLSRFITVLCRPAVNLQVDRSIDELQQSVPCQR